MAFTRWDPLRDLLALQERMERLSGVEAAGWTPPVDLYETSDAFIVSAELPGLSREDIDIRFHDGQLTLQGTRASPTSRASGTTAWSAATARSIAASRCPAPFVPTTSPPSSATACSR
jgi:HSP20 family molecular chaperone IbpA